MIMADISPSHKNDETTRKENHRPVSILPSVFKIFEKMTYAVLERDTPHKITYAVLERDTTYKITYAVLERDTTHKITYAVLERDTARNIALSLC